MEQTGRRSRAAGVLGYVLCYVLFIALVALSIGGFFFWQPTSLRLIAAILGESLTVQAVQDVSMIFMGFSLFGLLMAGEPYLRDGVALGQLRRRFLRLLLILVALIAVEMVIQEVLIRLGT